MPSYTHIVIEGFPKVYMVKIPSKQTKIKLTKTHGSNHWEQ